MFQTVLFTIHFFCLQPFLHISNFFFPWKVSYPCSSCLNTCVTCKICNFYYNMIFGYSQVCLHSVMLAHTVNVEEYRKINFWNMLIILSLLHGLLSLFCFMFLNYYNVIVTVVRWWYLWLDIFVCVQRILAFLHQQEMLLVDTADNLARMARETLVHARYWHVIFSNWTSVKCCTCIEY